MSVGIGEKLACSSVDISPEAMGFLEIQETGATDSVKCWRNPHSKRLEGSAIEGIGLFATTDIPVGGLIAIKPGHMVDRQAIRENPGLIRGSHQQIGPNLFLAGLTTEEVDENLVGYNHSCDPNARIMVLEGEPYAFLVARRNIPGPDTGETRGEEITVDYSTSHMTDSHIIFPCRCGSPDCRGIIQPAWDWEDPRFQSRYEGEFPFYIQDRVDRLSRLSGEELKAEQRVNITMKSANIIAVLNRLIQEDRAKVEAVMDAYPATFRPIVGKLVGRVLKRTELGQEIEDFEGYRLEYAKLFARACSLGNIEEMGIDRTDPSTVEDHIEEVVGFAEKLDYTFN